MLLIERHSQNFLRKISKMRLRSYAIILFKNDIESGIAEKCHLKITLTLQQCRIVFNKYTKRKIVQILFSKTTLFS